MWRACQPIGCSGARCSRISPPRQDRASSCSSYEATQTPRASAGRVSALSPKRQECSDQGSRRLSRPCSRKGSSSNSIPEAKAVGTRRSISSSSGASYGPLGSPYLGAVDGPLGMPKGDLSYGPLRSPEVSTSHGDGSSELQNSRRCIAVGGQLAARRSPQRGAEGGERLLTATRPLTSQRGCGLAASRRRWLMMTSWQDARDRDPAGGTVDSLEVAAYQRDLSTRASRSQLGGGEQQPHDPHEQGRPVGRQEAEFGSGLRVSRGEVSEGAVDAEAHAGDTREQLAGETVWCGHTPAMRAAFGSHSSKRIDAAGAAGSR